jgi:hypothetical protein
MDPAYTTGILRHILFGLQKGRKEFAFTYESSQIRDLTDALQKLCDMPFELSCDVDPDKNKEVTIYLLFET